jgi:hypothetical protein
MADKSLKETKGPGVTRLLKKSFHQKSDKEQLMSVVGVQIEPSEPSLDVDIKPAKMKAKVVATTRKVDVMDVDVDEEDWNEEIEFAPDDESKLGGLGPKVR